MTGPVARLAAVLVAVATALALPPVAAASSDAGPAVGDPVPTGVAPDEVGPDDLAATSAQAEAVADAVTAEGAVLYDPLDDRVLWARDASTPRLMASTTKIMTVLVALEAGTIDDTVVVSPAAAAEGGASLDLSPGQEVPMASLLAGLLLRSGNDAAVAVAEHLDGSEDAFVERMNARAAELGMAGTSFVNASGLTDDPAHVASPLDLARLGALAMDDERFAAWAGAATLTVPGLDPMESRNELLTTRPYAGTTGIKTGFTAAAGLCLVASATRDGRTLIAVVLGSEDSFADTAALFDHGFDDHHRPEVAAEGQTVGVVRRGGAAADVVAAQALIATVPVGGPVGWRARLRPGLAPATEAGADAGTAELMVDGAVVASVDLVLAGALDGTERRDGAAAGDALADALRAMASLDAPMRGVAAP